VSRCLPCISTLYFEILRMDRIFQQVLARSAKLTCSAPAQYW
jgi:hypothetical protein